MSRRTSEWLWPTSDWWMALCSESTGRMGDPREAARASSSSPASTSDSLLASPTGLPASTAAAVERRPAPPEMAASTKSTSGWAARAQTPASPSSTSMPRGAASRSVRAASRSATATRRGRWRRICSRISLMFRPAASATTSKRSGKRAATSSA